MVDLACLYERFDPALPLEPDDPAYVDWQPEIGLTDVKQQLTNSVLLLRDRYAHRLFTGHRGGGKTTELKRVAERLRTGLTGQRYFVSFLDADGAIDLDDVDPTDLVLAIVRQLITDLKEHEGISVGAGGKFRAFLEAAREVLKGLPESGVDLSVGDPSGVIELSTVLKRQPSIRREVRRLLEGRLPTLYDAINDELLPAVEERLGAIGYAGLLVIVDQLDRTSAEDDRHRKVFWEGRGKLKALNCHIVYTTPIEYAYSRELPKLENEYGELLGLPLLPVTAEDEAIRKAALGCVRQVATTRMGQCHTDETELFESTDALDDLIQLSGGHLRTLFLLMRTAIETSDLVTPLGADHVARVTHGLAAKYLDPLEPPEREVVRLVHATKARPEDERQLGRFYELLRDQYVFAYVAHDQRWYDWNPLLERSSLGEE
ncbi:MAG: hypothetical protein ACRDJG_13220 [Actinomycetota bacterium]